MSTAAVKAWPTHYYRGDGATPEVYTQLNEVIDGGDGPALEAEEKDVSNDDSTGQVREQIRTWRAGNEFTIVKNWILANPIDVLLLADEASGTSRNWKRVFSNGATVIFPAYVKKIVKGAGQDDQLTLAITFRVTGALS